MQSELFQDDLFPPTTVTWTPTMTAEEWYGNKDKKPRKVSLQPTGMDSRKCCNIYKLKMYIKSIIMQFFTVYRTVSGRSFVRAANDCSHTDKSGGQQQFIQSAPEQQQCHRQQCQIEAG